MKNKNNCVKIYLQLINYQGEVNDEVFVASFRNMSWAKPYIKSLKQELSNSVDGDYMQYKVERPDGKIAMFISEDLDITEEMFKEE